MAHKEHRFLFQQLGEHLREDPGHLLQIFVGCQKGRPNPKALKPPPNSLRLPNHGVIFHAVEQMGGLHHHIRHPIGQHPLQGGRHGVDLHPLLPQLADDHPAGPGPVHPPVRESPGQIGLDPVYGFLSGVVVGRTEAHHQKCFFLIQCRFLLRASPVCHPPPQT